MHARGLIKPLHFILRFSNLASFHLGRRITIGGVRYRVAGLHPDRLGVKYGYEPWLDLAYRAVFRLRDGVFIDVGVNTGQTLFKVLAIDSTRQYLGFEPQTDCCFYVSQFIKRNHLTTHTLLPIGLSDHEATVKLLKQRDSVDDTATIVTGFRPKSFYSEYQPIYVTKGDGVLDDIGILNIAVVKIDVEGAELEVVQGLAKTLAQSKAPVIFEVLNHFVVVTNSELDYETIEFREDRVAKLEAFLRKFGYRILNILPGNQLKEVEQIRPQEVNDMRITNYIAVHSDEADTFLSNFQDEVCRWTVTEQD